MLCIFCLRDEKEVHHTREHIIPQNIGGRLFIDEVCSECNSTLGSVVDREILKLPEILQALDKLNINYDKEGIIKHNIDIVGSSDGLDVRFRLENEELKLIPTKLGDGSLLIPEEEIEKVISQTVERRARNKDIKFTKDEMNVNLNKLMKDYKKLMPGEEIVNLALGLKLRKRTDLYDVMYILKNEADIERLIAKIFYEFLYGVKGLNFIIKNVKQLNPVIDLINKGKKDEIINIYKLLPEQNNYSAVHAISLKYSNNILILRVLFFGKIPFELNMNFEDNEFWKDIEEKSGHQKIQGIQFEQDILQSTKNFWLYTTDNKYI